MAICVSSRPKLLRLVQLRSSDCVSLLQRSLSTEPAVSASPPQPQDGPVIKQAIELLRRPESEWDAAQLNRTLFSDSFSASPFVLFKIARRLQPYTRAFKFLQFLRSNSPSLDAQSLSHPFQAVIELASREEDSIESVLQVYEASKELGIQLTPNAAAVLLRCLGRNGQMCNAEFLYNEFEDSVRDSHVRNVWVKLLLEAGCFDDALKVLDEMLLPSAGSKCDVDDSTVLQFFTFLGKKDRHGRIISQEELIGLVLRFARHGIFPPQIWMTQFVTTLCANGKTKAAWDVLDELMKLGAPVDASPYNALLTAFGREMDTKRMNELTLKMKESNILPTVVTFGILVNHLCKQKRIDHALAVLENMSVGKSEDGFVIEPDIVIYNSLIDGLSKVGRQEEALKLVERMRCQQGCSPNTITYNCLIDGFCKAGEIDKGLKLFDEMKEIGVIPNDVTVNTLVHGMCRYGRAGNAVQFLKEMKSKGISGTVFSYTSLIDAFCKVNNIEGAMDIFDEMVRDGWSPDAIVYYTLISGLSRAGRMNDALEVLVKLEKAGFYPDVVCYNSLIAGLFNTGKVDKAFEIFKEMEEVGVRPDGVTYNTLITYHGKSGNFIDSRRLLRKMYKEGHVPTAVTYGSLIHAYCENDRVNEAMTLFKELCGSSNIGPNTVIYNILITHLCKKNDIEQALSLMDDMDRKDVKPTANTFNELFRALRDSKLVDKAYELMDRMVKHACNPDYMTMEILTEWLSAIGQTEKLRRFIEGHPVSDKHLKEQSFTF